MLSGMVALTLLIGGQEQEVQPPGVLAWSVHDLATSQPLPARLTIFSVDGEAVGILKDTQRDPDRLAIRDHVVYTVDGTATIPLPAGRWHLLASRGLEWSIDETTVEIVPGETATWEAALVREVDTTGWICGDFHLHTLTHSGHGDSNMPERIISIAGEGVEFAVATDHDRHIDYRPTMKQLDAEGLFTPVIGNEVSGPLGHFNAFPLDSTVPPIDQRPDDGPTLFASIRSETNEHDVIPILQVNHPRWEGIDYFTHAGLDPVSGHSHSPRWSDDFDSVEILNENAGWGYHDADIDQPFSVGSSRHSVLFDWFNLLNRGHRAAAVGNSDSHGVYKNLAGVPRNYVASSTDDAASIDIAEIAQAIRDKKVMTTTGPFVTFTADGHPMGSAFADSDGGVTIEADIQAASWVDVDRMKVIVNGDVEAVLSWSGPREEGPLRIWPSAVIPIDGDSWVTIIVEGDDSMSPVIEDRDRPILPLAICNPVWIDADGDGHWTPPTERAADLVRSLPSARLANEFDLMGPFERRRVTLATIGVAFDHEPVVFDVTGMHCDNCAAAIEQTLASLGSVTSAGASFDQGQAWVFSEDPDVTDAAASAIASLGFTTTTVTRSDTHPIILAALSDPDRWVRIAGCRAARDAGGRACLDRLAELIEQDDTYVAIAATQAIQAIDPQELDIDALLENHDTGDLARFAPDIATIVPLQHARSWEVVGYFDAPDHAALDVVFGPESSPDSGAFVVKDGTATWREVMTAQSGYVDLRGLAASVDAQESAIAYARGWIDVPAGGAGALRYCFGADDASRLIIDGEVVYDERSDHGASPFQHVGMLDLAPGRHPVLIKVSNGSGEFGFYFSLLDESATVHGGESVTTP